MIVLGALEILWTFFRRKRPAPNAIYGARPTGAGWVLVGVGYFGSPESTQGLLWTLAGIALLVIGTYFYWRAYNSNHV